MARIAGVDLPRDKRVKSADLYLWDRPQDRWRYWPLPASANIRVRDLPERRLKLRDYIEHHSKVEGDLRRRPR